MKYLLKIIDSWCDDAAILMEILFFPIKLPFLFLSYIIYLNSFVTLVVSALIANAIYWFTNLYGYFWYVDQNSSTQILTSKNADYIFFIAVLVVLIQMALFIMKELYFSGERSNIRKGIIRVWQFEGTRYKPCRGKTKNYWTMEQHLGKDYHNKLKKGLQDAKLKDDYAKEKKKNLSGISDSLNFGADWKPEY